MSSGVKYKQSSSDARRFTCRREKEVSRGAEKKTVYVSRLESRKNLKVGFRFKAMHVNNHPSITAARAVKVNPIAMPIHGV